MASSCFLAGLYSQGIAVVLLFSSSVFPVATAAAPLSFHRRPSAVTVSANVVFQYFLNVIKIAQLINK